MVFAAAHESAVGRFCCKSLFALAISAGQFGTFATKSAQSVSAALSELRLLLGVNRPLLLQCDNAGK
jgi:hypothetical protein